MNTILKVLIIAVSWIIYISIGIGGEGKRDQTQQKPAPTQAVTTVAPTQTVNANTSDSNEKSDEDDASIKEAETVYAEDEVVNQFIIDYNRITNSPITDISQGNIRTKYFFKTYGFRIEIVNATTAAAGYTTVSINGNMDAHVPEMRDVFHDVAKTLDPNLADEEIYTFFDERTVNGNCAKDTPLGSLVCSVFLTGNFDSNGRIDIHN